MEPLSAAASLLGVVDVALRTTSALVKYARDTKHASSDRKLLAEEALFLSKLLERLRHHAEAGGRDETWLDDHREIVRQFEAAYDDLALTLKYDVAAGKGKDEGRFKAIRIAARWSFTKSEIYSLLERITRLQQYANLLLSDDQHTKLARMDQKQQEANDQKLKALILNWLSPLSMSQVHQTYSDRAEKGSGKWFLEEPTFVKWWKGDQTQLWCWGIPGAGKTVLTSIIINHLRQNRPENLKGSVGVVVMYLKYNEPEQTIDNVLASLLKQLAEESSIIPAVLLELYDYHRDRNTSPRFDEIFEALSAIIENYSSIFCVVDALDECSEALRWELIEKLEQLQPKLRLLITSRYFDNIAEELKGFEQFEIKANKADIELYIDHQIQKNRNLRRMVENSLSLRNDIKRGVVTTAENMFLLARLHVESLASAAGLSIKHVRNKLRTLPTTLTDTYDAAMQRVENQESDHRHIAFKALAWVSYALRSLSLKELQHALAVEPGDTELDQELVMDGQSITSLCAGLVVVDQRTNIVNLVHYSTKIYFDDIRHVRFPQFHASITLICATYLTLDTLKGAKIWEMVQNFPLACYAAQFMGDHARHSPEEALEPSILDVICRLLSHPDKRKPLLSLLDGLDLIRSGFYSEGRSSQKGNEDLDDQAVDSELPEFFGTALELSQHYQSDSSTTESTLTDTSNNTITRVGDEVWETKIKSSRIPEVTALHLAASMGLAKIASLLLKQTTNIDAVDETGKTALVLALERGFEKAVELLVNSGACVDLRLDHGRGVFLLVTERNWQSAGDSIAEKARITAVEETSVRMQDQVYLLLAVYYGHLENSEQILKQGNLELASRDRCIGEMALFLATEREHIPTIRLLLSFGVDINSKDDSGQTSLHRATRRKSEPLMMFLLENEAEVDCKDDDGRTPWSANLRCGNPDVLDILCKAGSNPSTCGLQGAHAWKRHEPFDSNTILLAPLHWAACYGHTECVRLLIEAGADVSVVSDQKVTPLDLAIQEGQTTVVEMLSNVGAKQYRDLIDPSSSNVLKDLVDEDEWISVFSTTPCEKTGVATVISEQEGTLNSKLEKLRLVFDKPLVRTLAHNTAVGQFVYPSGTLGPRENIYEVSHVLETQTSCISIRRSATRAEMWDYPLQPGQFNRKDMLYDITRVHADYQEFEFRPQHPHFLPGSIQMHRDWTGGWKVRHNHEDAAKPYLLRTTPDWSKSKDEECRWMTETGTLLARSGWEDATPNLSFELQNDKQMQDLLVTCWVVKLWSETAASVQ